MVMFKTTVDRETRLLNRHSCGEFYTRDKCKLYKHLSDPGRLDVFPDIVPPFKLNGTTIEYNLDGMVSLRTFIESKKKAVSVALVKYELLSFVAGFKRMNFVHGNLNLDNIFVNLGTSPPEFRVLDARADVHCDVPDIDTVRNLI